jgi:GMP synthase (glutamine-hydrolysing)
VKLQFSNLWHPDFEILEKVSGKIIRTVPGIVSVTYNIASKPPSTIEVV